MRLVTLNAWQGRLSRNLTPFFKKVEADIICLQELNSSNDEVPTWDLLQSLQRIKEASGLQYNYFSPTYGYKIMGQTVEFGNGILSKFPIVNKKTIFTNGKYLSISGSNDYVPNTRNAQIVTIDTPQGGLVLVNHHAHWETDPMGSEVSMDRIKVLVDELEKVEAPLIVTGDYNLRASSKPIKYLKTKLKVRDMTEDSGTTNTLSSEVNPFVVDCDHIFINEFVSKKEFKVSSSLVSDHKALIFDFDIIN